MLLGFFSVAVLLVKGVFALTISNVTVNGNSTWSLEWINSAKNYTIYAEADVAANWTVNITNGAQGYTFCNDTNTTNITCVIDLSTVWDNLVEGVYNVTIEAVNATNSSLVDVKTFELFGKDETSPVLNVSTAYTNNTWTKEDVTISVSAYDLLSGLESLTIKVNGTVVNSTSNENETISVTLNESGIYEVLIEAVDKAGNPNSTLYVVKIDKELPSATVTYPLEFINQIPAWINGTANDTLSGVSKVEVAIQRVSDGKYYTTTAQNETTITDDPYYIPALYNSATNEWSIMLSTVNNNAAPFWKNDTYIVYVRVYDIAGNINDTITYTFVIDQLPPAITNVIVEGTRIYKDNENRTWVAGTINIAFEANETIVENATSNLSIAKLYVDGEVKGTPLDLGNVSNITEIFTLDTTNLTDGNHTIVVEVCDRARNCVNSTKLTVWVDNTAPRVIIVFPQAGQIYNETEWDTIKVNIIDEGVGVDNTTAKVYINGTEYNLTSINGTYSVDVPLTTLPSGWYELKVSVSDLLGNSNNTISVTFAIDQDSPELNIAVEPLINNRVTGTVNITFNISDSLAGITKVICYYENGTAGLVEVGNKTYSNVLSKTDYIEWNTIATHPDFEGNVTVKCVAYDSKGHYNETTLTVYVDNLYPEFVKAYYEAPRKVKVEFSEPVRIEVLPFDVTLVKPDGTNETKSVTPVYDNVSYLASHTIILEYPVTLDKHLTIRFCDLADNCVELNVTPENAPETFFEIPAGQWIYLAFDYEVNTSYGLWKAVVDRNEFKVGTYLGAGWSNGKNIFGKMLYGYAIYVEKPIDDGFDTEILPIRRLSEDNVSTTVIQLKEGWNLVGVYDMIYGNGATNTTLSIVDTTLNTLRTETGALVFTYIARPTGEIIPVGGELGNYLPITFTEWEPYWVLIPNLVSRDYVNYWAPITPGNP